jgi:hypothetical protein
VSTLFEYLYFELNPVHLPLTKVLSLLLIVLHTALGSVKYGPIADYPAESATHSVINPEKGPQDRCIKTQFRLITSAGYDLESQYKVKTGPGLVLEPFELPARLASEVTAFSSPTVWLALLLRTLLFPFHSFL